MPRIYRQDVEVVPGFRLEKMLGRGGFGEVWKASAPGGTQAAIKVISLGEGDGLKELRSVQMVKQVRHPNLVPIMAYWLLDRSGEIVSQVRDESMARRGRDLDLIMAMGLGDKNLLDRLRECQEQGRPGIPTEELLNHMEDAARAIDFLNQPIHDMGDGTKGGIQHCDIKPQNILIVGGAVQVCDFGLARVLGDSRITSAKGSAAYMSPEMLSDNKPSSRSDQYSLAISYVELRTGRLPVNMSSPAAAIYAHVQGELDLSRLRQSELQVIKKATAVKPEDRFPTTMDMARALRAACGSGVGSVMMAPRGIGRNDILEDGVEAVPGYKLLRKIGQGGYGQVWEASAPGGKHIALKIISNLEGSQGQQEFRALELIKAVDHNHLMELHAYWLIDREGNIIPDELRGTPDAPRASTLVIASKLASKNLLQRLRECENAGRAGIPPAELIEHMRESADAIDYLNSAIHDLGDRKVSIQHRDIKPENILIASGVVKVGDFGLAKVVEGTSAQIHGDSAGLTLAYAAPEMFGNRVTSWSDQYCLALTYFKLRTGEFPFPPGCRPSEVIKRHVNGRLDLRRLAEKEREVIARATAVTPENRFPNCTAMVKELAQALRASKEDDEESLPPTRVAVADKLRAQMQQVNAPGDAARSSGTIAEQTPEGEKSATDPENPSSADTASYPPQPAAQEAEPEHAPDEGDRTIGPPTRLKQAGKAPEQFRPDSGKPEQIRRPMVTPRSLPAWKEEVTPERGAIDQVRRAGAAWKKPAEPQAAPRKIPLGWALALLGLVAVAGAVGLGAYLRLDKQIAGYFDRTPQVKASVEQLMESGDYVAALAQLDGSNWMDQQVVAALRKDIERGWSQQAQDRLAAHDYKASERIAREIITAFPENKQAREVLADAARVTELQERIEGVAESSVDPGRLAEELDAAPLPPEVRGQMRRSLLVGWRARADRLLRAQDFAKAIRAARALDDFTGKADAADIIEKATCAAAIKSAIDKGDFDQAADLLTRDGKKLAPSLVKAFRATITAGPLERMKRLTASSDYAGVVSTTGQVLKAQPDNAAALELREKAGKKQLASAQELLNQAIKLIDAGMDPKAEQVKSFLDQVIARANAVISVLKGSPYRNVADVADAHVQSEAHRLLGQSYEWLDAPTEAVTHYSSGLPNPERAQPEQQNLLVTRIEFLLNPRWSMYIKLLGITGARRARILGSYTERARKNLDRANADPSLQARTWATSGLAHVIASEQDVNVEELELALMVARTHLESALKLDPRNRQAWQWNYELARTLWRQRLQPEMDKRALAKEAAKLLKSAYQSAPTEQRDKIMSLLKKVETSD